MLTNIIRSLSNKTNSPVFISKAFQQNYSTKPEALKDINEYLQTKNYDKTQIELLDENCILVDYNDKIIKSETKKNCHLLKNINEGMLHRAFSIFLFDLDNRLLLQQRSDCKITYPNLWTNTCCSHPLFDYKQELTDIKSAARRRLLYEFGINVENLTNFNYITRIHYRSINVPNDNIFGEHEIDHILFVKGNYTIDYNKNEIKSYKYVDKNELNQLYSDSSVEFTPWFKLIYEKFLSNWWSNLDNLDKIKQHDHIHRFV